MKIFKSNYRIVNFILTQLFKSVAVRIIGCIFFAPFCFVLIWLTLSHLNTGPEALVWLVTAVAVLIGLVVVFYVNKVCARIDEILGDGRDESDDTFV